MTDFSVKFIRFGGYSFDEEIILELVRQANSFMKTDVDVEATLKGGHTTVAAAPSALVVRLHGSGVGSSAKCVFVWAMVCLSNRGPDKRIGVWYRGRLCDASNVSEGDL
jgi:hypothetical protein